MRHSGHLFGITFAMNGCVDALNWIKCYGWEINNFNLNKLRKSKRERKSKKKIIIKKCVYTYVHIACDKNTSKFYDSVVAAVLNIFEFEKRNEKFSANFYCNGMKMFKMFFLGRVFFSILLFKNNVWVSPILCFLE